MNMDLSFQKKLVFDLACALVADDEHPDTFARSLFTAFALNDTSLRLFYAPGSWDTPEAEFKLTLGTSPQLTLFFRAPETEFAARVDAATWPEALAKAAAVLAISPLVSHGCLTERLQKLAGPVRVAQRFLATRA